MISLQKILYIPANICYNKLRKAVAVIKIIIQLPQSTGFDIEIDDQTIHSKYEDITTNFFIAQGEHTVSAIDQAPTPSFWSKIIGFLNPISQSIDDFSDKATFQITTDMDICISVTYGEYDCVKFVFDEK